MTNLLCSSKRYIYYDCGKILRCLFVLEGCVSDYVSNSYWDIRSYTNVVYGLMIMMLPR